MFAGWTIASLVAGAASESVVRTGSACLNLRSKATSRSYSIDCLDRGTAVTVLKKSGKYSYVQIGNQKGYVFTRYLNSNLASNSNSAMSSRSVSAIPPNSESQNKPSMSQPEDNQPEASKASGDDLAALSWSATKVVQNDVIGTSRGYTLTAPVGWAKISQDGSIELAGSNRSHCTSATHAHFLTMIGELSKKGLIKLNSSSVEALNSSLFRDAWNSNGYANGKIMEVLGGQSFTDKNLVKKGDFMKMDRRNGSGHTTIFSHFEGKKVCYWSSNKSTRGPGVKCESMSGKNMVFSRINDLKGLQAGLDNLMNELNSDRAFSDVRRRGGNGYVDKENLEIASANNLKSSPSLVGETQIASLPVRPRLVFASAAVGTD